MQFLHLCDILMYMIELDQKAIIIIHHINVVTKPPRTIDNINSTIEVKIL